MKKIDFESPLKDAIDKFNANGVASFSCKKNAFDNSKSAETRTFLSYLKKSKNKVKSYK